jgi:hypothetical protein
MVGMNRARQSTRVVYNVRGLRHVPEVPTSTGEVCASAPLRKAAILAFVDKFVLLERRAALPYAGGHLRRVEPKAAQLHGRCRIHYQATFERCAAKAG